VGLGRGVKIPPSGVREGGNFKGVWVFLYGGDPIRDENSIKEYHIIEGLLEKMPIKRGDVGNFL
jgi:hypothetical protein